METFPISPRSELMMRTRISDHRQFAIPAFAFLGFLALASNVLASSNGEPDIPTMRSVPEPRSVEQEIRLANDYFVGRGVEQDFKQSAYWFEKAAKQGDPQAQMQIGYFYDAGNDVSFQLVTDYDYITHQPDGQAIGIFETGQTTPKASGSLINPSDSFSVQAVYTAPTNSAYEGSTSAPMALVLSQ